MRLRSWPWSPDPRRPNTTASPDAGKRTRAIKSLSEDDIAELRRGGWGLA